MATFYRTIPHIPRVGGPFEETTKSFNRSKAVKHVTLSYAPRFRAELELRRVRVRPAVFTASGFSLGLIAVVYAAVLFSG